MRNWNRIFPSTLVSRTHNKKAFLTSFANMFSQFAVSIRKFVENFLILFYCLWNSPNISLSCVMDLFCVYTFTSQTVNIYLFTSLLVNQSSSLLPRLLCAWFLHLFTRLCVYIPLLQMFFHLGVPTPFLKQHLILFSAHISSIFNSSVF